MYTLWLEIVKNARINGLMTMHFLAEGRNRNMLNTNTANTGDEIEIEATMTTRPKALPQLLISPIYADN